MCAAIDIPRSDQTDFKANDVISRIAKNVKFREHEHPRSRSDNRVVSRSIILQMDNFQSDSGLRFVHPLIYTNYDV